MQTRERERLIRQMSGTKEHRNAGLAKAAVCVGVLAVLIAVGAQMEGDGTATRQAATAGRVATAFADVRAEAHRRQVFDARRLAADDVDVARAAETAERQARMAYVAP